LGFKSTRLGGRSLNSLGMGELVTNKETRQGDNNIAMTKSIETAIAFSWLYNSIFILDLLNT